jgi:phosphoribosylaminoimidazolecarboxamide formyltransferase/IMP cyclohydrolase
VSIANTTGITEFIAGLMELGIEVYSTDRTKHMLDRNHNNAAYPVKSIDELKGITQSRCEKETKLSSTIPNHILAGILAQRDNPEAREWMETEGYKYIDLVVVNLGTFSRTLEERQELPAERLEMVEIGDATLLRAAAKHYTNVLIVVDPGDYKEVLKELKTGEVSLDTRRRLAAKAFQHTAAYDTYVSNYLRDESELFPKTLTVVLEKVQDFRYGENPHQPAALYSDTLKKSGSLVAAKQIHGKAPSYVNLFDLDVALATVKELASNAVAIVKHGSPCGLACGETLVDAYRAAAACDPVAAVGAAIAFNR